MTSHRARIAIVDVPRTAHARVVQALARVGSFRPEIEWIPPTLRLHHALASLHDVSAVAVPVAVRGGTPGGKVVGRINDALSDLKARGVAVYVAAGNRKPNALASSAVSVAPRGSRAALRIGARSGGSSGACVRAAALQAYLSTRRVRFRWVALNWRP